MTPIKWIENGAARIPLLALLLFCLTSNALAQSETDWEEMMQQMAEELIEADDEQQWEAQQEMLTELHEHPLNLNLATREQLYALSFLGAGVADEIIDYLATNGPMRTLGELRFIHSLTPQQREWLRLLVYVPLTAEPAYSHPNDTTWWGHARHDFITRVDVPLYNRAGWPWGRGIANRLRYIWQQGRHLDVGLRSETDAGEQMFTSTTPLWDSYGGHVMLRDVGLLHTAIIGDFKAGFGEGLVLNNGIRFGKLSMGLWRTSGGIRPHRSTDEANFLRGAAATLDFNPNWQFTALYSYRKLDATVADDNTVQTINTSGLHRTDSELRHKGTLGSSTAAINLTFSSPIGPKERLTPQERSSLNLTLGLTALYQYYDHQFHQNAQLYRQIYPEGYQFGAAGINYSLRTSHFYFSGETALSVPISSSPYSTSPNPSSSDSSSLNASSGDPSSRPVLGGSSAESTSHRPPALSTLNKVSYRFSPNSQLSLIQRYYGKYYYSPYASAYGENSHVQNESGITLLWEADRLGPIALRTFFDYFYSPWPRYTMTRYSTGWEGLLQTTYEPRRGRSLLLRYSVKSKEKSDHRYYSHRLRATYSHEFSHCWSASLTAFLHRYHEPPFDNTPEGSSSNGFAVAPRADYTSPSSRLRFSLFAILFRTDDYDSRLFLYEPSLLQTFGIQQLYGHGQRLAATLRLRSTDRSHGSHPLRWTAQIKVGVTHYTDRDQISSGPLLINSPWRTDIQLLLRLQLR